MDVVAPRVGSDGLRGTGPGQHRMYRAMEETASLGPLQPLWLRREAQGHVEGAHSDPVGRAGKVRLRSRPPRRGEKPRELQGFCLPEWNLQVWILRRATQENGAETKAAPAARLPSASPLNTCQRKQFRNLYPWRKEGSFTRS